MNLIDQIRSKCGQRGKGVIRSENYEDIISGSFLATAALLCRLLGNAEGRNKVGVAFSDCKVISAAAAR